MGDDLERSVNLVTYERMKSTLAAGYPKGHFVGISLGKVVADAPSIETLFAQVRDLGLDPRKVLAVQAGVEIPHYAIILGPLGAKRG